VTRPPYRLLPAILAWGLATPALAGEDPPVAPEVRVEGDATAPEEPDEDAPPESAFVSRVDVPRDPGPAESLADVLETAAGVRVRRLGGAGSPAAASIRGSTPAQVQIFLDGVPLDRASFDVVDLSDLPLGALERVDVHRGGVPASLGGAGVGGAIDLRTRGPAPGQGAEHSVAVGGGSFGTRSADLSRAAAGPVLRYRASAHYRGTRGDFPYFDNHGTTFEAGDDRTERRANNDSDAGAVLLRAETSRLGRTGLTAFVSGRTRGIPGAAHDHVTSPRARSLRALTHLRTRWARFPWDRADLSLRLHHSWLGESLSDPDQELGRGPLDTRDATHQGGARGVLEAGFGAHFVGRVVLDGSHERFTPGDVGGPDRPVEARWLWAGALALDTFLLGDRVVLSGAVRADHVVNRFSGEADTHATLAGQVEPPEDTTLWSPRAGLRVRVAGALHLKANVGLYHRIPAFHELFGRRAALSGNAALRPEEALNTDFGYRWESGHWGPLRRAHLEGAVFTSRVDDVVVFVPNSPSSLVGQNLARSEIVGVEQALSAALPWGFDVAGSWTELRATNESSAPSEAGKRLPGRPARDLSLRTRWATGGWELGHRVTHVSGAFRDVANTQPIPDRQSHDLFASWSPGWGLRVGVEARNVLDQRIQDVVRNPRSSGDPPTRAEAVSDVAGWPLPGRSFFASVRWTDA